MNAITGIITTLNEEKNIVDCIQSLQLICNEIIVVDSLSSDKTVELAEKMGAKVYLQAYLGDGIQKNVGLTYATNSWIFSLDADERITPELAAEINTLDLDRSCYEGYAFRRRNFIGSRWIKCCRWYPDYLVRLFHKEKTRYKSVKQHACVDTLNFKKIPADFLHYSFQNIGELFYKNGRNYSTRSAKILYLNGRKANFFTPIIHSMATFFSNYFIRGGCLGGIDGFSISLSAACNNYLKYAKLLEYQRDKIVLDNENFDEVW